MTDIGRYRQEFVTFCSDEGLTLEPSTFEILLRWLIYFLLKCSTCPPTNVNFYNNSLLFIIHIFDSLMRSMYQIFTTNKNLHVSSPKQLLVELQKVRNIDMSKEKEDSCLTSVT